MNGEGMRLKGGLHRLECREQLGFTPGATGPRHLLLPVHQRQQVRLHPMRPPRRQDNLVLHIVPHPLPPHVEHGGSIGELLVDFVEHALFDRQSIGLQQRLERGDLSLKLRFNLLGTLGCRVRHPPRVPLQRYRL